MGVHAAGWHVQGHPRAISNDTLPPQVGFIEYADVFLRRGQRMRSNGHRVEEPPMWQLAMAAGAVGLIAFTVKHAFS